MSMSTTGMELSIVLDNEDHIRTNAWLEGRVIVTTRHRINSGKLNIDIVGKESASVRRRRLLPGCIKSNTEESAFFFARPKIHDFSVESITHGETAFPILVFLNEDLPPTVDFRDSQDGRCSVDYSVVASLNGTIVERRFAVAVSKELLSQPLKPTPLYFPLRVRKSRSPGSILLAARVETPITAKGGSFTLSLACRNESGLSIQRLDARLVESIAWRACGVEKKHAIVLESQRGVDYSTLKKPPATSAGPFHGAGQKKKVALRCPYKARSSAACALVEVSHYIEVVVVIRNRSAKPRFRIPVEIVDRNADFYPENIAFKTHELATLQLEDSDTSDSSSSFDERRYLQEQQASELFF